MRDSALRRMFQHTTQGRKNRFVRKTAVGIRKQLIRNREKYLYSLNQKYAENENSSIYSRKISFVKFETQTQKNHTNQHILHKKHQNQK